MASCSVALHLSLQFKQALGIEDLTPGMVLSGVVRNVVDFGAFVDVNAGQVGAAYAASHGEIYASGEQCSVGLACRH